MIIRDEHGADLGRGLIAYDAVHAEAIKGRNSRDIAQILGTPGRAEMIHRDDMALEGGGFAAAKRRDSWRPEPRFPHVEGVNSLSPTFALQRNSPYIRRRAPHIAG